MLRLPASLRSGKMKRSSVLAALVLFSLFGKINLPGILGPNVAKLKEQRNIDGLIRALDNPDPEVQFKAAEALGDIGDLKSVPALARSLKSTGFAGVRWKAAEAPSKIGDPAVSSLVTLLQHTDDDVRWKAGRYEPRQRLLLLRSAALR